MRKKRRKKPKPQKFKINFKGVKISILTLLILLFFSFLAYLVYTSDAFKISQETVKANTALSQAVENSLVDKTLFSIDPGLISKRILKNHPEYKSVSIKKIFPSTVKILVEKRIVFAQIKTKLFYPIDREAIILDSGKSKPMDEIIPIDFSSYRRRLSKGSRVDDQRLRLGFELIDALMSESFLSNFKVELIDINNLQGSYFIAKNFESNSGEEHYFEKIKIIVGQDDYRKKIQILKRIINDDLRDKLELVKYIDLRHDKVYVGFKR